MLLEWEVYPFWESKYFRGLPREDRELILGLYNWMVGRGLSQYYASRTAWDVARIVSELGVGLRGITYRHAQSYVARLAVAGRSPATITSYVEKFRLVARYLAEQHGLEDKRAILEKLKPPKIREKPPPVLTQEEVEKLVETAVKPKTKALIALLAEGGLRVGEVLKLKVGDMEFDEYGAKVYVKHSKSQPRTVRIIKYAHHLQAWLQNHPQRDNPQAWLFPQHKNPQKPMTRQQVGNLVKHVARRAGVKKNVHPHVLRHTRATLLAKHLTDRELMTIFGWKTERMVRRYTHLTMRDAEESLLTKVYGIKPEKQPPLQARDCPRCGVQNPAKARFCWNCGYPFEEAQVVLVQKEQRLEQLARILIEQLRQNPDLLKELLEG